MRIPALMRGVSAISLAALLASAAPQLSAACTRALYLGPEQTVVVGRSMDWVQDPGSNLWLFPRGMKRNGAAGPNSLTWTSKYGSLVTSFYEVATVDGINDQGLVANVLYLVESDYGKADGKPTLSIAAWAQYVLDSFATVAEAVDALSKEPFVIVAPTLPNGSPAQGHLSLSDPSGDSAIFEYVGGKLVIHHGRQYQVMTNSPIFSKQLTLDSYWEQIGPTAFLPGTSRASDRFVRASFFIKAIPQTADQKEAVASAFSVIRSVSVPLGISTPGEPNIASTIWRTLYDQKNKVMFFDSATSPTVFWVPLSELDFKEGAPVKKLTLVGGKTFRQRRGAVRARTAVPVPRGQTVEHDPRKAADFSDKIMRKTKMRSIQLRATAPCQVGASPTHLAALALGEGASAGSSTGSRTGTRRRFSRRAGMAR